MIFSCNVTTGVGTDANYIRKQEIELHSHAAQAPWSGALLRRGLSDLQTVIEECSNANWDSFGAKPVGRMAIAHAFQLLRVLPSDLPPADIGADPDGEISFEWARDNYRFSVSVAVSGNLSYAGLFGRSSTYGNEEFADCYLPAAIRANLRRLFPVTFS